MSTEGRPAEPAASAPAGAHPPDARRTGPILADRMQRQRAATASRCLLGPFLTDAALRITKGTFRCRRWKPPTATKVIYGVNELDLDLAGKSVRGIWKVLEQVLNIPRDAAVTVNGSRVDDDYVVRPGDEIEFQKQAGVKGLAA